MRVEVEFNGLVEADGLGPIEKRYGVQRHDDGDRACYYFYNRFDDAQKFKQDVLGLNLGNVRLLDN